MSPTKNLQHPTKNFFLLQTKRLVESFEGLNSFLVQSAEE